MLVIERGALVKCKWHKGEAVNVTDVGLLVRCCAAL